MTNLHILSYKEEKMENVFKLPSDDHTCVAWLLAKGRVLRQSIAALSCSQASLFTPLYSFSPMEFVVLGTYHRSLGDVKLSEAY